MKLVLQTQLVGRFVSKSKEVEPEFVLAVIFCSHVSNFQFSRTHETSCQLMNFFLITSFRAQFYMFNRGFARE